MLSRKKRDAKFLIFQSLYLIAIAILFYKGTDLSLNKVREVNKSDTVINKTLLPDSSDKIITITMYDSLIKNPYVDSSIYTIVPIQTLADKDKRISDLEKIKAPRMPPSIPEEKGKNIPQNPVKGGRTK